MKAYNTQPSYCISAVGMAAIGLALCGTLAQAQPNTFSDSFDGTSLDPAWVLTGPAAGHVGLTGSGLYVMTDAQDGDQTTLQRNLGGSPGSFIARVSYVGSPLATPNTQTDVNWRFFGPDGFVEVAFNSFQDIRVWSGKAGMNVGGPVHLDGYADGTTLNLQMNYDLPTDTFEVLYGLNGGPMSTLANYTGAGNFYGNFTDVRMFKWGAVPDQAFVGVDFYELVVPEPGSFTLFGLGAIAFAILRRRR